MSRAVDRGRRVDPPLTGLIGVSHYRHVRSRYSTVHLVFDIFQGIGIAAAVGIRPFLPALAVGALAAGDVEIHFNGTDYSFLQSPFPACAASLADHPVGGRAAPRLEKRISGAPLCVLARSRWRSARCCFAGALAAVTTRSGRV